MKKIILKIKYQVIYPSTCSDWFEATPDISVFSANFPSVAELVSLPQLVSPIKPAVEDSSKLGLL